MPNFVHLQLSQVVLSPSDLLFLSPKWQDLFKTILVTTTDANLEDFPHWIHLSHFKLFTSPPQDSLSSYTVTQKCLYFLKFQRTSISAVLPQIQKEKVSPHNSTFFLIFLPDSLFEVILTLLNAFCFINFLSVSQMTY